MVWIGLAGVVLIGFALFLFIAALMED